MSFLNNNLCSLCAQPKRISALLFSLILPVLLTILQYSLRSYSTSTNPCSTPYDPQSTPYDPSSTSYETAILLIILTAFLTILPVLLTILPVLFGLTVLLIILMILFMILANITIYKCKKPVTQSSSQIYLVGRGERSPTNFTHCDVHSYTEHKEYVSIQGISKQWDG